MKDVTDSLDSKTGIFTRHYYFGHKSVYFGSSKDEIQRIEALYFKLRLDTLPDNYEPPCEVSTIPTFVEEFIINYKGKCTV